MKIIELIGHLSAVLGKEGNLDVRCWQNEKKEAVEDLRPIDIILVEGRKVVILNT